MTNSTTSDDEVCDRLLTAVKKEVKHIMEEAVTKKFIHEESSAIISLCGAVECCLTHGLKKRALGLFKNSTTTALLHKISKQCESAADVVRALSLVEQNNENARKSVDGKNGSTKKPMPHTTKYLWIKVALFEKQLYKIVDYLVQNASKYYEKDGLICDPCDGPILAALLVGPCALDYTKMKTADHYWTDPPADELVQRHRIHSSGQHHIRSDSPKRPGLQVSIVRRHTSSSSEEGPRGGPLSAKEYVESLHQNAKSQLLYGKNNVIVQPKEDISPLAGYLSLHQGPDGLSVKWTPNQLMNGCCKEEDDQQIDRSLYWDYAVTIYLEEIVYLHCHQQPDSGGTIVLVGQDGVQRSPIHFPKGGHLLAFLSCMETGLLPHGQLDPPLWSQRGKGKVFPRLKKKNSQMSMISNNSSLRSQDSIVSTSPSHAGGESDSGSVNMEDEEEATDYVFRIITSFRPDNLPSEILDPKAKSNGNLSNFEWTSRGENKGTTKQHFGGTRPKIGSKAVTSVKSYAKSQEQFNNSCISKNEHRTAVRQLCDTMKNQILSRAFYGWLSYCRHLKTVRTHLSGLVNNSLIPVNEPHDASDGLTLKAWESLSVDGIVTDSEEIFRLVYYGGCVHAIRNQVWPYLLGYYVFGSTINEREELDTQMKSKYEDSMSEWLAIQAIVNQRDKEALAANLVKYSQGSTDGHIPLIRKDSSLSNDVFESIDSDDFSHPETVPEETSSQLVTPTEDPSSVSPLALADIKPQITASPKGSDGKGPLSPDEGIGSSIGTSVGQMSERTSRSDSKRSDSYDIEGGVHSSQRTSKSSKSGSLSDDPSSDAQKSIIVTQPTVDAVKENGHSGDNENEGNTCEADEEVDVTVKQMLSTSSHDGDVSPASNASNGGVYSAELLENVALNLHRIDKDVQRCDRNYRYFTPDNLDKLRNIMCTYVWENLEIGYVQGMCDLLAPILVVLDDEWKAYCCFCELMKRMTVNFPHGGAMDQHFANMRSLIQILDPELFEHMHQNGDYTHFYFCYRWFLLDFKRELVYEDIFHVWETIWAARNISSPHFVLFIALALVEYYREIIIDNNMDFTDIIKFFNEMAERHPTKQILHLSRDLVYKLQDLIENK